MSPPSCDCLQCFFFTVVDSSFTILENKYKCLERRRTSLQIHLDLTLSTIEDDEHLLHMIHQRLQSAHDSDQQVELICQIQKNELRKVWLEKYSIALEQELISNSERMSLCMGLWNQALQKQEDEDLMAMWQHEANFLYN